VRRGDLISLGPLRRSALLHHLSGHYRTRISCLISARAHLISLHKDLEGHIRGILKTFGIRVSTQ
ncbi:hypothetical protein Q4543_24615, partial [Salipiger sp. 1_MG-2023]|nr:hypothetical protein [Salipiger sp. 1_MG-2023]